MCARACSAMERMESLVLRNLSNAQVTQTCQMILFKHRLMSDSTCTLLKIQIQSLSKEAVG